MGILPMRPAGILPVAPSHRSRAGSRTRLRGSTGECGCFCAASCPNAPTARAGAEPGSSTLGKWAFCSPWGVLVNRAQRGGFVTLSGADHQPQRRMREHLLYGWEGPQTVLSAPIPPMAALIRGPGRGPASSLPRSPRKRTPSGSPSTAMPRTPGPSSCAPRTTTRRRVPPC